MKRLMFVVMLLISSYSVSWATVKAQEITPVPVATESQEVIPSSPDAIGCDFKMERWRDYPKESAFPELELAKLSEINVSVPVGEPECDYYYKVAHTLLTNDVMTGGASCTYSGSNNPILPNTVECQGTLSANQTVMARFYTKDLGDSPNLLPLLAADNINRIQFTSWACGVWSLFMPVVKS